MNEIVEVKNKVGRPLKYQTVEELQNGINKYFDDCSKLEIPLTITGLCLSIGTTRETIREYEERPEFVDAIKRAKELIANYVEIQCLLAKNPAGAIFLLKNHGFTDKQEIDHTITQKVITVDMIGNIDD